MKPGYKQTEAGVIPVEWELSSIGTLCAAVLDCHHSTPVWTASGSIVIRNQNIRDGKLDFSQPSFTDETHFAERTRRAIPSFGDLVITREAPMGLVCMIPKGLKCCLGQRMVLLRLNHDAADTQYLLYALLSEAVQRSISVAGGTGSTVSNLRIPVLKGLEISAPPLPEQRAIAEALSDVDGLLGALDRLIAKKRDLKQAAMQQLLTGQTRLPGFHGEWVVKTVAELEKLKLVKLSRGQVISKKDIDRTPGDYPIYSSSIHNDGLFGRYGYFMFDEELITWSVDGGGNFFHRRKHRFSVTNVCGFMRVDTSQIDCRFFAAELQLLHSRKNFDYQSKAHPSVIRKEYEVQLPPLPEQTAIASVLSEMDAELAGLEQRREKTRALKQGMMQELLTGRTRLV
jgi:type I restriction enzyme S subunit